MSKNAQRLPQAEMRLQEIQRGITCPICGVMHELKRYAGEPRRYMGVRCQSHRSSQVKAQCNANAMKGTGLCRRHSGGSERNKAKGRAIMLEALDDAMSELVSLAMGHERDSIKLRAIENLLDRNGYPRKTQYALEDARDVLSQRLGEVLGDDDPADDD